MIAKKTSKYYIDRSIYACLPQVSEMDRAGFLSAVRTYLAIMACQGLLSAGFNAAFSVVSRKVLFAVRTKLFEKVLGQDVAFFDGTTSGLSTRLLDTNTVVNIAVL